MKAANLDLIQHVLSVPTMSFHEEGVATFVKWYSYALGLHLKEDKFGNLLVYNGSEPQGVMFNAHMDHPGFEVISSRSKNTLVAQWGKVDPRVCTGAKVIMYAGSGAVRARVGKRIAGRMNEGRPLFRLISQHRFAKGDFGHFDLPGFRMSRGRIFTRAADNLMSVAAILDLFTRLNASRLRVTGLFTRGEEAGFLGAFGAMETGIIPKRLPLIVLECSSARHAKVAIGDGPVIRVAISA
jgi:putative aminopeptidase FrvX